MERVRRYQKYQGYNLSIKTRCQTAARISDFTCNSQTLHCQSRLKRLFYFLHKGLDHLQCLNKKKNEIQVLIHFEMICKLPEVELARFI